MNVVFVNYGNFGNNSSGHIDGFAKELRGMGHAVGIIAGGDIDVENREYHCSHVEYSQNAVPEALYSMLHDDRTIIHAWTPREAVRQIVEPLAERGLKYIVHLEDNERIVTSTQLGIKDADLDDVLSPASIVAGHLSHPHHSQNFLAHADAVTGIVMELRHDVPKDVPFHLLEPGVDTEFFKPKASQAEISYSRYQLGIPNGAFVIVYNGNIHPAIERDVYSLYSAVSLLRRAGKSVFLVKTGESDKVTRRCDSYLEKEGVIELGRIARRQIPRVLEIADILVQPGSPTPFNVCRLPSKILEFLAMARPVIMPFANIGLQVRNGLDAVVLHDSSPYALATAIAKLLDDPCSAQTVGRSGRDFVSKNYNWNEKTSNLLKIYESVLSK
ncbi:glycosyltransferase [Methylobacterium sp. EM32]|uniref:glycosyltransferase n=1 Tax=Methylobacterium sp. EM32 TaxID=3163481 RepID=UPI0033BB3C37